MKSLRSNPPLTRLFAAWAQSCVGTGAGYVALLLLTYEHLHSSWAISVVLLAEFVPAIAFGSWFGSLADRYPRRRLIVGANVLQAAAYGGLALVDTAVPIVALALLAGAGNALQRPALRSALPVVAGDARQAAVAVYDTCRWIGLTVGPLAAAALFAFTGLAIPLAANAASFLIAAVVIAGIEMDGPARQIAAGADEKEAVGTRLREGLAAAFAAPGITAVVTCSAGAIVGGGLLNVCEPILATHTLHGSSSDYALLVACYGIGMVAATALVARRGDKPAHVLIRRYIAAVTLFALGMLGSSIAQSVLAATVAFMATGYANALQLVSETQLIQIRVPNAVQGRLFGAKDTVTSAFFLLGLVAGGGVVAAVGVRITLGAAAAVCGACAVAAFVSLRAGARRPLGEGAVLAPTDGDGDRGEIIASVGVDSLAVPQPASAARRSA